MGNAMAKVAVILSGCGYLDGAEVREAVLSLLYLDQQGASVSMFAPNVPQMHVINHLTGEPTEETRNVLEESARIARGHVAPLSDLDAAQYDALVIPGGFGVAKNLSDFAVEGSDMEPDEDFARVVNAFFEQGKPIGAICISPAVLIGAIDQEDTKITVTIGDDEGAAQAIREMGGEHQKAPSDGCVVDAAHKIISCSAYMREDSIAPIAKGIKQVITRVIEMTDTEQRAA